MFIFYKDLVEDIFISIQSYRISCEKWEMDSRVYMRFVNFYLIHLLFLHHPPPRLLSNDWTF